MTKFEIETQGLIISIFAKKYTPLRLH